MADSIGIIRIVGIDNLIREVATFSEEVQKRVSMEIEASCMKIVRDAKRLAPANVGRLKQGITYVKHSVLDFEIVSAANYSAYMEFGTKSLANVPADYADLAAQFKGVNISSGGVTLKQAIYTWAKQKGIDPKIWYVIYRKIYMVGVRPHPFFIPALVELNNLEKRIRKYVNNVV